MGSFVRKNITFINDAKIVKVIDTANPWCSTMNTINLLHTEAIMKDVIIFLASIVNNIHDKLLKLFGIQMTDKELHFWIIGVIGIVTFFFVYSVFKIVEKMKWSITILAFIYTLTVMIVLVFAIELQQAITNRGNMEFADAVMGLWGFIVFFIIYCFVGITVYLLVKVVKKKRRL